MTTVDLPEGSVLAMATAGLADAALAPSGALRPLLDSAATRPLQDLCDALAAEFSPGRGGGEPLMLLARTKALPQDDMLNCPLPVTSEAAPIARKATLEQLSRWRVDEETAYTMELVVSELVGNAIRYGAAPLRLRLIRGQRLTCEVSDGATSVPRVQHARTVDESGRGLFIVASLTDQWGTRFHPQGKTVWAELPAAPRTDSQ